MVNLLWASRSSRASGRCRMVAISSSSSTLSVEENQKEAEEQSQVTSAYAQRHRKTMKRLLDICDFSRGSILLLPKGVFAFPRVK